MHPSEWTTPPISSDRLERTPETCRLFEESGAAVRVPHLQRSDVPSYAGCMRRDDKWNQILYRIRLGIATRLQSCPRSSAHLRSVPNEIAVIQHPLVNLGGHLRKPTQVAAVGVSCLKRRRTTAIRQCSRESAAQRQPGARCGRLNARTSEAFLRYNAVRLRLM